MSDHTSQMLSAARSRAKKRGVPFALTADDISIPSHCPILSAPLTQGGGDWAPSLDRIKPELGYVPGNVIVISQRANRIKNDATPQELYALAEFYFDLDRATRWSTGRRATRRA